MVFFCQEGHLSVLLYKLLQIWKCPVCWLYTWKNNLARPIILSSHFFLRILWTLLYCLLALSIFSIIENNLTSSQLMVVVCLDSHKSLPHICVLITSLGFILVLIIIISFLFWTTCTHYIWRFKSHGRHSRNIDTQCSRSHI